MSTRNFTTILFPVISFHLIIRTFWKAFFSTFCKTQREFPKSFNLSRSNPKNID